MWPNSTWRKKKRGSCKVLSQEWSPISNATMRMCSSHGIPQEGSVALALAPVQSSMLVLTIQPVSRFEACTMLNYAHPVQWSCVVSLNPFTGKHKLTATSAKLRQAIFDMTRAFKDPPVWVWYHLFGMGTLAIIDWDCAPPDQYLQNPGWCENLSMAVHASHVQHWLHSRHTQHRPVFDALAVCLQSSQLALQVK